jgi:GTP-binding protein EngB required for normal cell division
MRPDDAAAELNSAQKFHLVTSAQYADKLLSEVESVLFASKSKSAFKKYKNSLSPAQVKVVEDYIARIRAQMVRVLEAQGVALPEPQFESIHSIRVSLTFIKIAFEECTPNRMRGYGDLSESKIPELNGLVDEMVNAVEKLDSYLTQGLGQDLEARLARLERAGDAVDLIKKLERIINAYGFVEFRSTLSMIIERLEAKSFEIALFGRVSSGKSSLLNRTVQSETLPVGVNPITAVPTRLVYGHSPRLTVLYADRSPQQLDAAKLPEFVTEQQNPANYKHVTRIIVELPSARLRDGIVLVDTPGLGSLATSGAAETLAYLPRCDLGVVLIDAGSTLTQDDVSTIQTLYEAGTPALVLLSKSDLLLPDDRVRSLQYVSELIHSQLGLRLEVHPVSAQPTHSALLEDWLNGTILPLYDGHQQLMEDSLRRKIGLLRESVETALRIRLDRAGKTAAGSAPDKPVDSNAIDARLRKAMGRFTETRDTCWEVAHRIRDFANQALMAAALHMANIEANDWPQSESVAAEVQGVLVQAAAEQAGVVFAALEALARELAQTLKVTAQDLGFNEIHKEDDLLSALKEMPKLDVGTVNLVLRPPLLLSFSKSWASRRIERSLQEQIGNIVSEAFSSFGSLLNAWARRALSDLQLCFDSHADVYRAHLDRLTVSGGGSDTDEARIRRDLDLLAQVDTAAEMEPVE